MYGHCISTDFIQCICICTVFQGYAWRQRVYILYYISYNIKIKIKEFSLAFNLNVTAIIFKHAFALFSKNIISTHKVKKKFMYIFYNHNAYMSCICQ